MEKFGHWFRLAWDRAAALVLMAAGLVVLVVGWAGVSGRPFPAEQLPYLISGGIGGAVVVGLGALCWLSADLRDEWIKLDRVEDALNRLAHTELVDHEARR